MSGEKYHNIEFLRFIFAIIIVYFHILHANIMKYIGNNYDYKILAKLSDDAGWIVECFFIISGYFLYKNIVNSNSIDITKFIWKKITRLWPVLIFSIIIGVVFFKQNIYPAIFNSLFLQCIGFSLDYKGINWYISPLFWALILYYAIFKNFDNKKAYVFVGGICYFGYLININYCHGGFGRGVIYNILDLSFLRALAGIGLGILIGKLLTEFTFTMNEKIKYILFSIIEISSIIFLIRYFLFGLKYKNAFIVIIVFSLMFISFVRQYGILSQVLNLSIFSQLGKYAYSIYVMQQISFWIMQKTLWKTQIVENTSLCILVSLIFSIILGVITYHLIEKPFSKYLINRAMINND